MLVSNNKMSIVEYFFADYCSYRSYSDSDTLDIVFVVSYIQPCDFLMNSSLTHCLITFIC